MRSMFLSRHRRYSHSVVLFLICCFWFPLGAFAQRASFGVVMGTSLVDDFRSGTVSLPCFVTYPGQICPSATVFSSEDASRRFILGPKMELRLSNHFSLEAEALHRAIRRKGRFQYI